MRKDRRVEQNCVLREGASGRSLHMIANDASMRTAHKLLALQGPVLVLILQVVLEVLELAQKLVLPQRSSVAHH